MPAGSSGKFKKRVITLTRTTTGSVVGTVGAGGQKYFRPASNFRARVTGSGTTSQIELKDAAGRIWYKDAADKDYQTANVDRIIVQDETVTGLFGTRADATGAALAGTNMALDADFVLEGPITVTWADADGTAGTLRVELFLEV